MKRLAVAIFLVCVAASAQTAQPTAREVAGRAEALRVADVWLDSLQVYRHIPALSAGVVIGDDLVWAKGYGTIDAAHTVPAAPNTIYSICSISKVFTSVALMQQLELNRVALDAPIDSYLPWATLKPAEDSGPITLRGLLTHSAGIPRESDFPYWTGPDYPFPSREQVRDMIARQAALYPAQRYFQYSNLGLTLVGETVAAVSGEDYPAYAKAHILTPLGLNDTRTYMPLDLLGKQLAVGYGALNRDGTRDPLHTFNARGITPAAGYTSTVEDLGKFASWQFRLLRTGKPELLKAPTLREMQRVQFMDPDWKTTWGLGMAVNRVGDQTYVGHGGDCPGYHSSLWMRNADQTAIVAMDTGSDRPGAFVQAIFGLLDKRAGFSFKAPEPAGDVKLEEYVGRYSGQPWGSETAVLPWAGGLAVLDLPSADPAGDLRFLKPKGGDSFRAIRKDGTEAEEIYFVRDDAGRVVSFVHFSNPSPLVAPLPPLTGLRP